MILLLHYLTGFLFFLVFKDLTRHVLNSMMGYIALPAILQKIVQVYFVII